MSMWFTAPLGILGLLALPALAVMYWLGSRLQRRTVSSLLLWTGSRAPREGGRWIERLRMPLSFLLESLAITLIAMASARPFVAVESDAQSLVVIADDSFSMAAGGEDSARTRAVAALRAILDEVSVSEVRVILAGEHPRLLGDVYSEASALDAIIERWDPAAAHAGLEDARRLAAELSGSRARILVLSDGRPPPGFPETGTRWLAFGRPLGNVAITSAFRRTGGGIDRCLFEVRNLSSRFASRRLRVVHFGTGEVLHEESLELGPDEGRRVQFSRAAGDPAPPVLASIGEDALRVDDHAVLLPNTRRQLRVHVQLAHAGLQEAFARALEATGSVRLTAAAPDLTISGGEDPPPEGWSVRWMSSKDVEAFLGPFIVDGSHPLACGLALGGVIWSAGRERLSGSPVISAGDVVLLSDSESPDGSHALHLQLEPGVSTLLEAPAWPVLIANLVHWRIRMLPGLSRTNFRLGERVELVVGKKADTVRWTLPNGSVHELEAREGRVVVEGREVGVHTLHAGEESHAFAVNALDPSESDLRTRTSGEWGRWDEGGAPGLRDLDASWPLLLAVLCILAFHARTISSAASTGGGA